jgi:uncharacterized protein (TIGR02118 family)
MMKKEESNPTSSRRSVLAQLATVTLASAVPGRASAAESRVGQECMTILYQNGDDVTFDFDYYESHHMPLIMRLYGDSIGRFELRRGLPGPNGARPPYIATINIWIADPAAFDAAGAEHGQELVDDVPNFTNTTLTAQRDRVAAITSV